MTDFLKRNFVLVLGVSLPVLLIAALLLLHGVSRLTAAKPAHPVLYVSFDTYFGGQFYDFDVDEAGQLEIGFTLPEGNPDAIRRQHADASLALYDAGTGALSTFRLEAPDDPPQGQRVELGVPEALAARTFSEQLMAPDGYRLELSTYRGGGLLRELFGAGGSSHHHRLVKDGVSFRVPNVADRTYGGQEAFVGWVVDEDE